VVTDGLKRWAQRCEKEQAWTDGVHEARSGDEGGPATDQRVALAAAARARWPRATHRRWRDRGVMGEANGWATT
jgi:hypothetical protein